MNPAQWAELELELGHHSDAESSGQGSERSVAGSDSDTSGSDSESYNLPTGVKRLAVLGGTLAFALVVVVGGASSVTATSSARPLQRPTSLQTGQALSFANKQEAAPQVRSALTLTNSTPAALGVPVPVTVKPLAPAQLAVNKRRFPDVKPDENLHNGNVCDDSEELYAGLCYTKCSILTGFPQARRSTAFSCCPTSDCHGNVFKMKTASLLPCKGYDVSSSDGGKACPHIRGECLEDEEQFMGECFEKCSVLTNGKFTQRIGAASCCNPAGVGGCWNFGNDDTNAKLNVGGGKGDGDASTPRASHFPLKYLTETN